jgi:hypothetical protein
MSGAASIHNDKSKFGPDAGDFRGAKEFDPVVWLKPERDHSEARLVRREQHMGRNVEYGGVMLERFSQVVLIRIHAFQHKGLPAIGSPDFGASLNFTGTPDQPGQFKDGPK